MFLSISSLSLTLYFYTFVQLLVALCHVIMSKMTRAKKEKKIEFNLKTNIFPHWSACLHHFEQRPKSKAKLNLVYKPQHTNYPSRLHIGPKTTSCLQFAVLFPEYLIAAYCWWRSPQTFQFRKISLACVDPCVFTKCILFPSVDRQICWKILYGSVRWRKKMYILMLWNLAVWSLVFDICGIWSKIV